MAIHDHSRRTLLIRGGTAATGLAVLQAPWLAQAVSRQHGGEVIPWMDQPPPEDSAINLQPSEELGSSWLTPTNKFFRVSHYEPPQIDAGSWNLQIDGLVREPQSLSLATLQSQRRQQVTYTLVTDRHIGANL